MDKLALKNQFDSLKALEIADKFIDSLKDSTYLKKFKTTNDEGKEIVSKGDALAVIVMGFKIGLDPITSLSIGSELKGSKIYAVDKGVALGLTPLEAIKLIHVITNKQGSNTVYSGIDLITRQLNKAKVKIEILKDHEPIYSYEVRAKDKNGKSIFVPVDTNRIIENDTILDKYYLYDASSTQEEINKAKEENKLIIRRYISDYETVVRLTRTETDTIISLSYKRSQAVKAGYLEVTDQSGNVIIPGKLNWNNHEVEMMRARCISSVGRIIASDMLHGLRHHSELPSDVEDIEYSEV